MQNALIDPFNRRIEYLRVSVTDRCDLRCSYCIPKGFTGFEEPGHWLTFDEMERAVRSFTELGVRRVRLTGGEPLSRGRLPDLAARLARLPGLEDLSLSTNGMRLRKLARPLRRAGITRLNVSLDSLNPDRFAEITGGGRLDQVLDGLMAAKAEGFTLVKINMVAMKGVNESEIGDMVDFCIRHDFTLRLIETMPMGATGRKATEHYLDLQEVKRTLQSRYELIPTVVTGGGPARYVRVGGTNLRIGFITPISQHFCATCNRVRLAVDGTIYTCLGQENNLELRPLLRSGATDAELREAVCRAISLKPERHEFTTQPQKIIRFMSATGG
ncbi:MAG: GTP 3',8-cyclase MoaA [Gammaproteobacteria bacterium]|nr:GTP 3',8-cyclase MoaA [Gammaproteobacteria bacterium]